MSINRTHSVVISKGFLVMPIRLETTELNLLVKYKVDNITTQDIVYGARVIGQVVHKAYDYISEKKLVINPNKPQFLSKYSCLDDCLVLTGGQSEFKDTNAIFEYYRSGVLSKHFMAKIAKSEFEIVSELDVNVMFDDLMLQDIKVNYEAMARIAKKVQQLVYQGYIAFIGQQFKKSENFREKKLGNTLKLKGQNMTNKDILDDSLIVQNNLRDMLGDMFNSKLTDHQYQTLKDLYRKMCPKIKGKYIYSREYAKLLTKSQLDKLNAAERVFIDTLIRRLMELTVF
jgi:hypothetical protein